MTDSPRAGSSHEPGDPYGNPYPAYAGDSPYGPAYGAVPPAPAPTEPLGPYWTQAYGQMPPGPPPQEPPPEPPKTPRWLWVAAGLVVLVVVGLVAALIITYTSSSRQTVVAPLPPMPQQSTTTTPTTPSPTPMFPLPLPTLPGPTEPTSPEPTAPGETEPVVYNVTGTGRAINITYVDTGSVMQTEFNVVLPWHKEVSLPKPATDTASVTVINVGRDITCTVTVSGVQVRQVTGAGLTICSARSG